MVKYVDHCFPKCLVLSTTTFLCFKGSQGKSAGLLPDFIMSRLRARRVLKSLEGHWGHLADLHLFLWGVRMLIKAFYITVLQFTLFVWMKSWLALVVSEFELEQTRDELKYIFFPVWVSVSLCLAQVLTTDTHWPEKGSGQPAVLSGNHDNEHKLQTHTHTHTHTQAHVHTYAKVPRRNANSTLPYELP